MNPLPANIKHLLYGYLGEEETLPKVEICYTRSKNRGGVLRLPQEGGGSVVIKVWRINNLKERVKSAMHISNGWREWRMHRFIHMNSICVPAPLYFHCLTTPNGKYWEVMALEDLGKVESGVPYFKRLIKTGQEKKITDFEDQVILTTAGLLSLQIHDIDNQLNNFLVDPSERIARIDFECARRYLFPSSYRSEYAKMLDRLFRSHIHATYPNSERSCQFISKVMVRLSVPKDIKLMTTKITMNKLQYEKELTGIDYAITFDW